MFLKYVLFILALLLTVASFYLYHHKHKSIVRGLGILLAYVAGAIALKLFFMISQH